MKLVIAEKPSVAAELAKVLGADARKSGYHEGGGYYVTWAVGHLVQLAYPTAYGDYKSWRLEDLPILPQQWCYELAKGTAGQYKTIQQLTAQADVSELICATDAGREGELIFRLIYNQMRCKKPFKRLWVSSMEPAALQAGFATLKDGAAYDDLYAAADARQKADWLIGMNFTRLFSCKYNSVLNIGRVQTPTLRMVVDRSNAIKNFVPQDYYIVAANLGDFKATTRVNDQATATAIVGRCRNKDAYITSVKKEGKKTAPPKLFDLTGLQKEANKVYGFTAQQTLELAQSLYEKKVLTYPRTDSKYITADIQDTMTTRLQALSRLPFADYGQVIQELLAAPLPQIANDSKVSDHHAIIPTMSVDTAELGKLTGAESSLLALVCVRLLAALSRPYQYTATTILLDIEQEAFKATGRTVLDAGWKAVENQLLSQKETDEAEEAEEAFRREYAEGEKLYCHEIGFEAKQTTPPAFFNDNTLLAAMEHAGKDIADDDLKDAIKKGLGTPATRAATIEKLLSSGFLQREKKLIKPTDKGITLISLVPPKVTDPLLTAEWEYTLDQVAQGKANAGDFLAQLQNYITGFISSLALMDVPTEAVFVQDKKSLGACPICKGAIYEGKKNFYCENKECGFSLWKEDNFFKNKGKSLSPSMVTTLLTKGKLQMKNCKSLKSEKLYNCSVSLTIKDSKASYELAFENNM